MGIESRKKRILSNSIKQTFFAIYLFKMIRKILTAKFSYFYHLKLEILFKTKLKYPENIDTIVSGKFKYIQRNL